MPSANPLVKLIGVSKSYDATAGGQPLTVLKDISLHLEPRETMAIVGPSGCGKSTLLNIMGTLDRPSSGQVLLGGQDLNALKEKQLARLRNEEIGFVFQAHHLLPQCTVRENVLIPTLAASEANKRGAEERADRLLKRVGLSQRLNHRPGELSGGERQRVAVVRALINGPALLLADEPTGALDRESAEGLTQLLVELNEEEGVTLVVVTHSLELARRMKRLFQLRDGQLHETREGEAKI